MTDETAVEAPPMTAYLAAMIYESNAHLIATCADMGYLKPEWHTLDPTYGKGNWWKTFRPDSLVAHDLAIDGVDFTKLPHADGEFDCAVYDPPYIAMGGRKSSGLQKFQVSYGLDQAPQRPVDLQFLINDGLIEVARCVRPKGYLLVKAQDYVSGGKFFPGTHYTINCALDAGLEYCDRVEYIVEKPRAQPTKGRKQRHFRRNLSTLMIFRTPRKKK